MGLDTSKDINPNAARGYILEKFTRHKGGVNCMIMQKDKYLMATGGEDKCVVLWRINTTPTQSKATMKGHTDYISCLAFHNKYILSGSNDYTVRKWCMSSYDCLYVYEGHKERVNRLVVAGDFMFSSSIDHTVKAWTLNTHQYSAVNDTCLKTFEGHSKAVYPLVFIPDDNNPLDGKTILERDILISGSSDKTIRIWSFHIGKSLHVLKGHKGTVNTLVVDPEGKLLFSGGGEGTIICWNISTGDCVRQMTGHESAVLSMIGHNKMLYSCSTDKTARAWIMEFGECIKIYRDHTHSVTCIKYLDGYIYTGCADTYSRMFKAKTGECKRVFKGHTKAVVQVEVVYDKLYTVSVDGTLRVWDTTGILDEDISSDEVALEIPPSP
ncbi:WD repeat-containing protein 86 [Parasteatoda tepidariorum]|uniref:WD repeat-containing protein 86 n=1 Tax=Parasteatoda tepidariorum TaxID=114398 RepID=UPI001C724D48|nr:WD repeat-containing protein 86 [Parasteatoda tepidariorum]